MEGEPQIRSYINQSVPFNHYLLRRLLFLGIDIRFAETLAELDYRSIHDEGHGGVLGLGLIEERQSTPANSRVDLWEAQHPNPQNTNSRSALRRGNSFVCGIN